MSTIQTLQAAYDELSVGFLTVTIGFGLLICFLGWDGDMQEKRADNLQMQLDEVTAKYDCALRPGCNPEDINNPFSSSYVYRR